MISIVTPTFNCAYAVSTNIPNVREQFFFLEHIIIDGGSTDGTLDFLEQYSSDTLKYISEPDQRPYDAMNKGIKMATGDVIGILNAADFYAVNRASESMAEAFEDPSVDSCYGDLDNATDVSPC